MERICRKIFADAGLSDRQDFKQTTPLPCKVGKAIREFIPHYSLRPHNNAVAVWQRVDVTQSRDVDSAAFMFEKLLESKTVSGKQRCGALIHGQVADAQVTGAVETLAEYSTVIDVDDESAAHASAEEVAFGR